MPAHPPTRSARLVLPLLLIVAAAALRFPVVRHGNPFKVDLGSDEGTTRRLVGHVLSTGDWNTRHHLWPSVNAYLSVIVVWVTESAAHLLGSVPPPRLFIGRGVAAAAGTLTVLLVYLAGARLIGRAGGLLAAGVVALAPLHLERSRVWLADVPMTLFYTLALWLSVLVLARPTLARYLLAGVAVGLATATKYNGAAAAFPVALAAAIGGGYPEGRQGAWRRLGLLAVAGAVAPLVFVLVDPYAVLDWREFRHDLRQLEGVYTSEPATGFLGLHAIAYVARGLFTWGVGPIAASLAVIGAGLLVWPVLRRRRVLDATVLIWAPPLLYLLVYNSALRFPLARNFLLLLPHLALAAAYAIVRITARIEVAIQRLRPGLELRSGLQAAVLLLLVPGAVAESWQAVQPDTRDDASHWIYDHVPPGARVLREWPAYQLAGRAFRTNSRATTASRFDYADLVRDQDYVVVASECFDYVLEQRRRPGFAARAAVYDALFSGRDFELAARFAPGLDETGPEIRVYRNLAVEAPVVGHDCVDLAPTATANFGEDDAEWAARVFELRHADDRVSGSARILEPGRYALVLAASARVRMPIEVGLGRRVRRYWVKGETAIRLAADLEPGVVWWRVAGGRGWPAGRAQVAVREIALEAVPLQIAGDSPPLGSRTRQARGEAKPPAAQDIRAGT